MANRFWRYAWPLPWTLLGLAGALLVRLGSGRVQIHSGVLEAYGGAAERLCTRLPPARRFDAITLGHVILGLNADCLSAVRAHEHVHVRQYERWGPLFVPAYLASSLWQILRGRRAYRDNHFERQAYAADSCAHQQAVE